MSLETKPLRELSRLRQAGELSDDAYFAELARREDARMGIESEYEVRELRLGDTKRSIVRKVTSRRKATKFIRRPRLRHSFTPVSDWPSCDGQVHTLNPRVLWSDLEVPTWVAMIMVGILIGIAIPTLPRLAGIALDMGSEIPLKFETQKTSADSQKE